MLMQYGDMGTLGQVRNDGSFVRSESIYRRVKDHLGAESDEAVARFIFR